jgi:hypothetical protein
MALKQIRLELARDHDFPHGSSDHGYEFVAPLDATGHLALKEWKEDRSKCYVKRFWSGEPTELGYLVHKRGGVWAFDYDPRQDRDDEPGFKLNAHLFKVGEYVSIQEHDGNLRTFRVAAVTDLS